MPEVVSEEQPRIKFQSNYQGDQINFKSEELKNELLRLATLQAQLESLGVIPILNDGLVGGNCSLTNFPPTTASNPDTGDGSTSIYISKSGKDPGATLTLADFVLLTSFDRNQWTATYRSTNPDIRPSSDAPLHFAALTLDSCSRYSWSKTPRVAVHGHALAEGQGLLAAAQAGMPISEEETLFSTPTDLEALEKLFKKYPYPENQCYIRRGHGFFLLADTVSDAEVQFERLIVPLLDVK